MNKNFRREIASSLWSLTFILFIATLILSVISSGGFILDILNLLTDISFFISLGYSCYTLYKERELKKILKDVELADDLFYEELERKTSFSNEHSHLEICEDLSLTFNDRLFKMAYKSTLLGIFMILQGILAVCLTQNYVDYLDIIDPERNQSFERFFYDAIGVAEFCLILLGGYLIFFINTEIKSVDQIDSLSSIVFWSSLINVFILLFIEVVGQEWMIGLLFASSVGALLTYFVGTNFKKTEMELKLIIENELINSDIVNEIRKSNIKLARALRDLKEESKTIFKYNEFWAGSFSKTMSDRGLMLVRILAGLITLGFMILGLWNQNTNIIEDGTQWVNGWYCALESVAVIGALMSIYILFFLWMDHRKRYEGVPTTIAKVFFWIYFVCIIVIFVIGIIMYLHYLYDRSH